MLKTEPLAQYSNRLRYAPSATKLPPAKLVDFLIQGHQLLVPFYVAFLE